MVKGISKRVVVIKSPDPEVFEEAIFIVREDFFRQGGVSSDELVRQARRVALDYTKCLPGSRKLWARIPAPAIAAAGAAATGIALLAMRLAGV